MKIAIITNRYYPAIGGSETFSKYLADSLVERGHQVTVYCSNFKNWYGQERFTEKEETINGVVVKRLSAFRLLGKDATTIIYPLFSLSKELNQFDVIHTFAYGYSSSWIIGLLKMTSSLHRPIVFSAQYNGDPHYNRIFTMLYDQTLGYITIRTADSIILETSAFDQKFGDKVIVQPPMLSPLSNISTDEIIEFKKRNNIPTRAKILLSLSRISEEKGIPNLLVSLALMRDDDFVCIIAGDGAYLDQAKEDVKRLGIYKKVIFIGPVYNKEKALAYKGSDAFISLSVAESFGITILEALSARLPIIASNIPTYAEILRNIPQTILVSPTNTAEVVQAIKRSFTYQKQETSSKLLENYAPETVITHYETLYQTVAHHV